MDVAKDDSIEIVMPDNDVQSVDNGASEESIPTGQRTRRVISIDVKDKKDEDLPTVTVKTGQDATKKADEECKCKEFWRKNSHVIVGVAAGVLLIGVLATVAARRRA